MNCGCANAPSLNLSATSRSICGTAPVTVSGNTFSNATQVTITENGAGSVNASTAGSSPFSFTYTPAAGDAGNTVIITVTTDNPSGAPCEAAVATYSLTVNEEPVAPAAGTITQPTCSTPTGSVILTGLPSGSWTIEPGNITGTGSNRTITGLNPGTYNFTVTNAAGCISEASDNIVINTVPGAPSAPAIGAITQPTCATPTGSVTLSGLPAGNWTINPGNIAGTGSGTTITGLVSGTHNFTVTDAAGCTSSLSSNVVINTVALVTPTFTQIGPLLQNSVPPALPLVSTNSITGTWNPAAINTTNIGNITYTFTPDGGQCATTTTMTITVTAPGLTITKTATETGFSAIGDIIHYTIVVTNSGSIALSNIIVTDPLTGLNQTIATLASGANRTINTTHTIVQNDLNAGRVDNTATASYIYGGTPYSISANETVNINQLPSLSITKNATESSYTAVGNVLHYTITIRNTGTVTLTSIAVTDPLTGLNQTIATLAPAASSTISTTYSIVQNDINTGAVNNTARAVYTYGGTSHTVTASESVSSNQNPALTITKTATEASYASVGTVLHYTIVVRNTGNVTLTNIAVTDPLTGLNQTIATLAPAASSTISTTYSIVQNDINTGAVNNTARAVYTYGGTSHTVTASESVSSNQNPALTITKTATEASYASVGTVLHYTIVVRNTGNVTLTNIAVTDPLTGLNQTIATLAPAASSTINTTYTTTQNDINAGVVNNTARAVYSFSGTSYTRTASESVTGSQNPGISITKSAAESTFSTAGTILHFTLIIRNTGNVTLANIVSY